MRYTIEQLEQLDFDNIIGLSINNYFYHVDYVDVEGQTINLYDIIYGNSKTTLDCIVTQIDFDKLLDKDLIFYELKPIDN